MIFRGALIFLVVLSAATLGSAEDSSAPAFAFQDVKYFHRWSQNQQHEFTPAKQEDLDHWSDMITINGYPGVGDGDKLAEAANGVLENYRNHQGKILRTNSVPQRMKSRRNISSPCSLLGQVFRKQRSRGSSSSTAKGIRLSIRIASMETKRPKRSANG